MKTSGRIYTPLISLGLNTKFILLQHCPNMRWIALFPFLSLGQHHLPLPEYPTDDLIALGSTAVCTDRVATSHSLLKTPKRIIVELRSLECAGTVTQGNKTFTPLTDAEAFSGTKRSINIDAG